MSANVRIVTNHWGWNARGIWTWFRYGWGKPLSVWGIEVSGSSPRRFTRRAKVGPISFNWGEYPEDRRTSATGGGE